jgi:pantetheine-phosphate adenylyltransferase
MWGKLKQIPGIFTRAKEGERENRGFGFSPRVSLAGGRPGIVQMEMRLAIYPGSFDPITNGHVDVIARAATLFDEVIVAVAVNEVKHVLFGMEERVEMIRAVTGRFPNVKVVAFEGLLVEFAREQGAVAVVRGLRAVSDFEFEFQMALMNRKLEPAIETVFLTPREEYTYLSSRIVKEIARLGGPVDAFVPGPVVEGLRKKLRIGG